MEKDAIIQFLKEKIAAGSHYTEGPTGGLITAAPVERIADWFRELLEREPEQ